MRKSRIVLLAVVAILLAAALAAGIWIHRAVQEAETAQEAVYRQYTGLLDQAGGSVLTVTEQGEAVGAYTLADLGLWEDARAGIDRQFRDADRLRPEDFAALSLREKLAWRREARPQAAAFPVSMDRFDPSAVLEDLAQAPRTPAQNAYAYFQGGAFQIRPERPGSELDEASIRAALTAQAAALEIPGGKAALELTDFDCYLPPEITVENGHFDFQTMLAQALADMTVTLRFHHDQVALTAEELAALVQVDGDGLLEIQPSALDALTAQLAQARREENTPYIFQSYAGGDRPIDFLPCTYTVDTAALGQMLTEDLLALRSASHEAPYLCTDSDGQPFGITDTYVEVDIQNQQMTYYKDGELVVTTPVVTGFPNWRDTPTGLYSVLNKDTNCWLTGPDFHVFIKYWVGFIGTLYGLHDASWRTEFGGVKYKTDGSHGCVNTPEEAMATIHETIAIGTPVLVY